jgi:hypothetical protein
MTPHPEASHRYWTSAALLAAACLGVTASARADSLNCNNRIASTGDSRYEVKAICGEPDDASQRVEYRKVSRRVSAPCAGGGARCRDTQEEVIEIVIDEWIYDFGRNRFIQHVTFEQGRLVRVESRGYGHKPPR